VNPAGQGGWQGVGGSSHTRVYVGVGEHVVGAIDVQVGQLGGKGRKG